jgi:hypothetical protein
VKNIDFLLGGSPDLHGRMVSEYLQFTPTEWESQHDVIQMAFPTKTQSRFHPGQPFMPADFYPYAHIPAADYQRCKATISLLLHSYLKSLWVEFLINHGQVTLTCTSPYPYWAASADHNTLRLTRILECLGIFGMVNIQTALHDFLVYNIAINNSDRIHAITLAFWVAAKENKLSLLR